MTSDTDWDPTIYDNTLSDSNAWCNACGNERTPLTNPNFDQTGNHRHQIVATHSMCEQLHYFDTNSFEPPDDDDNILLCMNNEIITITDDDDCVIVPPPHIKEKPDDECIIVTPPQVNLSLDTADKPIKILTLTTIY